MDDCKRKNEFEQIALRNADWLTKIRGDNSCFVDFHPELRQFFHQEVSHL